MSGTYRPVASRTWDAPVPVDFIQPRVCGYGHRRDLEQRRANERVAGRNAAIARDRAADCLASWRLAMDGQERNRLDRAARSRRALKQWLRWARMFEAEAERQAWHERAETEVAALGGWQMGAVVGQEMRV